MRGDDTRWPMAADPNAPPMANATLMDVLVSLLWLCKVAEAGNMSNSFTSELLRDMIQDNVDLENFGGELGNGPVATDLKIFKEQVPEAFQFYPDVADDDDPATPIYLSRSTQGSRADALSSGINETAVRALKWAELLDGVDQKFAQYDQEIFGE